MRGGAGLGAMIGQETRLMNDENGSADSQTAGVKLVGLTEITAHAGGPEIA